MKTIINPKTLLSFLSLAILLLGSCSAGDKLGSETQGSQNQNSQIVNGGGDKVNKITTNIPTWDRGHFRSKAELAGWWKAHGPWNGYWEANGLLDTKGNIILIYGGSVSMVYAAFGGKVDDIFSYPYTIKLIISNIASKKIDGSTTFTFYSATNGTFTYNNRDIYISKQSDKFWNREEPTNVFKGFKDSLGDFKAWW